jgi:hypothetical protein
MVGIDLVFERVELLKMTFGSIDRTLGDEGGFLELRFVFRFRVSVIC